MKLRELGYKNLYFKDEKDKFNSLYGVGETPLHKIGFTTTGQSRSQILTKLEQVIRNKELAVYSSRLYDEMKTFIWKGTKAQAQKGKNDDLVMSLAIGVWLFDTSPVNSKHSVDINNAMLNAFAVNRTSSEKITSPWSDKNLNPFKPIVISQMPESGSNEPYGDFGWLL